MSRRIKAVIFDLDGTLVDSRLDFALIRQEMGIGPEPILEQMSQLPESERLRCQAILDIHEWQGAERAVARPGAAAWVCHLDARGVPRAILTRNSRSVVERTLERVGLPFEHVVAREDAPAKPDPAGVFALCDRFAVSPAETLVIGDYAFDIDVGLAAGAQTALVTFGRDWPFAARAHHCWADLAEGLERSREWF